MDGSIFQAPAQRNEVQSAPQLWSGLLVAEEVAVGCADQGRLPGRHSLRDAGHGRGVALLHRDGLHGWRTVVQRSLHNSRRPLHLSKSLCHDEDYCTGQCTGSLCMSR